MAATSSEESRSSAILKSFFSIESQEIEKGLEEVSAQACLLRSIEKKFRRKRGSEVTPGDIAWSYHRRLLLGALMGEVSRLPEELVLFSITLPAYEIAELACEVSCERGALEKLSKIVMDCEESGFFEGYESAARQSEEILSQIHDTMFTNVLERYGHHHLGEFYENNRPLFELQQEVGRRLVSPELVGREEGEKFEAEFRKKFGPEFVQEFTRRLECHGLVPA